MFSNFSSCLPCDLHDLKIQHAPKFTFIYIASITQAHVVTLKLNSSKCSNNEMNKLKLHLFGSEYVTCDAAVQCVFHFDQKRSPSNPALPNAI